MKISETLGRELIEMLMSSGYNTMTTYDKNLLVTYISEKEGLPLTDVTRDYVANMVKDIKIKELSSKCEETVLKGFVSPNGHSYRTNRDDQINMIGQKDLLDSNPQIETVMWKTEDVGYIPHTRDEWTHKVYFFALNHRARQLFKYDYLKQLVLNAETEEQVVIVDWDKTVVPNGNIIEIEFPDEGLGAVEEPTE